VPDHGRRELLALAVFLGTDSGLAGGGLPGLRVDRAGIAVIGAALMLVTSVVANLIVVEAARSARVEIGFGESCRVGVLLTIATLLLGWAVLVVLPI
jgi:hypothetical protein